MSALQREAATSALLAAFLEQGKAIHLLSVAFTALSVIGVGLSTLSPGILGMALFLSAALLGAFETFLALRVGFDAGIFRMNAAEQMNWADVDHGLAALNLVARAESTRSEESRRRGALRLFRRQATATALQGLLVLGAFPLQDWLG